MATLNTIIPTGSRKKIVLNFPYHRWYYRGGYRGSGLVISGVLRVGAGVILGSGYDRGSDSGFGTLHFFDSVW